jgi:hypothetical protein
VNGHRPGDLEALRQGAVGEDDPSIRTGVIARPARRFCSEDASQDEQALEEHDADHAESELGTEPATRHRLAGVDGHAADIGT